MKKLKRILVIGLIVFSMTSCVDHDDEEQLQLEIEQLEKDRLLQTGSDITQDPDF